MIISYCKCGPEVRGECHGGVATRLEHTLSLPLKGLDIPFIDGSVHTAADQSSVLRVPHDATNLQCRIITDRKLPSDAVTLRLHFVA